MATEIDTLIQLFSRLPGLGPRSARRAVLHLIRGRHKLIPPLIEAMAMAHAAIGTCSRCGNLDTINPCAICADPKRDETVVCVVEDLPDLWAIERGHLFRGRYHVLGGTLSALDGRGPQELNIASLILRAQMPEIQEIILATNATVDGQTTAHYLTTLLRDYNVKVSRLAQGIPIGGELDYLDDGTLGAALKARLPY